MNVDARVEPLTGNLPSIGWRWDPETDILSGAFKGNRKSGGLTGTVELTDAEGSVAVLDVNNGVICGLDVVVWPEVTTVAEAAFGHQRWAHGLRSLAGLADLRVIRCQVSELLARSRMKQRLDADPTRAAHADGDYLAAPWTFEPLTVDSPTLNVLTSHGYDPDLPMVVAFCRA